MANSNVAGLRLTSKESCWYREQKRFLHYWELSFFFMQILRYKNHCLVLSTNMHGSPVCRVWKVHARDCFNNKKTKKKNGLARERSRQDLPNSADGMVTLHVLLMEFESGKKTRVVVQKFNFLH